MWSLLGVVEQSELRLTLALCELNKYLKEEKFKNDDLKTAALLFEQWDCF